MPITKKTAKKTAASVRVPETPVWFYKFGRFLIALSLLAVSVSYDISVAEVSGDSRWYLTHWTVIILVIACFLFCLNRRQNVITFRAPPIIWLVVFLIFFSALSMLWTLSPYHSWWSLKHFSGYTAVFGFIYLLRHEKWYTSLLWMVAFGVGFNCLIGIAQFHVITDASVTAVFPPWNYVTAGFTALLRAVHFPDGMDKPIADTLPFFHHNLFLDYFCQVAPPAGTQANKNLFGSYLVLTLPAVFYLFLSSRKRLARLAAITLFAMGVITLLYTRSRASWLSALCAAIFFVSWLLLHQQYRQTIKTFFTKTVLILLAVVCLATIGGTSLRGKLGMQSVIEQVRSLIRMTMQDNNDVRVAYDLNGLAMIKDRPFHGVGIGAFHTVYPAYYQAVFPTPPDGFSMYARPSRMHNDLEQAFVELGILGGLAYLGVFLTLLVMTWRIGTSAKIYEPRLLSLCLMTGIVGLSINALMDFPLQLPLAPTLLWSFAGMLTGIYVMHVEKAGVGLQIKLTIPRFVYMLLTIAAVAGGWAVFRDDWSRRKGDQYLKIAIALASSGRFDEQTLLYLRKSMDYYIWNVRLQEYRALIYPNYTGRNIPVSVDDKIREVEAATKYDPYSPHKLINLGGLYIIKSQELAAKNRVSEAFAYARQAEDVFNAMLKYPGFFSDMTYTIGGMSHMLQGILQPSDARSHLNQAYVLLEKALEFNPNYDTARGALKQTQTALTHFTGQPVPDGVGGTAPTNALLRNVGIIP
ncbi:MAG: O-antigen ligase family protein [Verrucomicrobia bacterium]|nr:O-antigen ligase family protein [Verrucomicrobiota bacterium]MBU1735960.1 O-antigen ligase family protein [Verrucomicrobiota bacterium]MBU1855624.1 O-antigen ligase family protein [Verrucomicrobiota bacterium]